MATNILSPRSSADSPVLSSPRHSRGVSSPWTQVVRGVSGAPSSPSGENSGQVPSSFSDWPSSKSPVAASSPSPEDTSAAETQPESSEYGNAAVKQVWGKPSNGNGSGNGARVEVSPVMDTISWPALSACTKVSPKSTSSDELPLPPSQGSGVTSLPSNKPVIANSANPSSTPNHATNTRQKSMKRGSANGGFIQPSPQQPQGPAVEMLSGKLGNTTGESSSHKEGVQKGGSGNDHQPQRSNSFNRRGSGGQHPRGDGSYHHGYAGRRDQGNQDWNNSQRSFGGRDNQMQQQRGASRGYTRAPHASAPFIPPPPVPVPVPVRPFASPMVYSEVPLLYVPTHQESLRGMILPQMPQMYYPPAPDHQLQARIVTQIDYYFSNENLIKDTFLRQNMDEHGWVPVKLIAGFKKVMNLTDNIQLILNAVQASTVVEVQNDKIRKRNEWMKWIMPPGPFSPVSSPQALARSGYDMLAGQLQGVALDEKATSGNTEMLNRSPSEEFSSQLQQYGGGGAVQAGLEGKTMAVSPSK